MKRCLAIATLLAGCVINAHTRSAVQTDGDTLRARASFDFRCSKDQLVVTEIDSLTAGVDGCGQRGTYVFTSSGTWVLNSPGGGQGQGQEPLVQPPQPPDRQPLLPQSPVWQQQPPGAPPSQAPGSLPGHR